MKYSLNNLVVRKQTGLIWLGIGFSGGTSDLFQKRYEKLFHGVTCFKDVEKFLCLTLGHSSTAIINFIEEV